MSELKIMKNIKGRIKLIAAGTALGTGLLFTACEAEVVTPDGQTVIVDDSGNITPVPTDPVEPEIIETDPVDEPEVEPEVVEVPEPDFILYDKDGNFYQPQHVTLEDFYARVAEVEEKYEFENDWERDVYVSNLVAYNADIMDKKDIDTIYHDYLENLGTPVISQQCVHLTTFIAENTNKIAMADYFLDPVLAEEASKFENFIDNKSIQSAMDKFNKKLKDLEAYDASIYNSLYDMEYWIYDFANYGKNVEDFYGDKYIEYSNKLSSLSIYMVVVENNSANFENYEVNNYVSSHQDEKIK